MARWQQWTGRGQGLTTQQAGGEPARAATVSFRLWVCLWRGSCDRNEVTGAVNICVTEMMWNKSMLVSWRIPFDSVGSLVGFQSRGSAPHSISIFTANLCPLIQGSIRPPLTIFDAYWCSVATDLRQSIAGIQRVLICMDIDKIIQWDARMEQQKRNQCAECSHTNFPRAVSNGQ